MDKRHKRIYIRTISLLAFLSLIFGIVTVVYATKADRYRFMAEVSSQRAISELCESLDNITVNLQKSLYTGTSEKLSKTGNELNREASIAKVCLGQLTDETIISDEIYKFLSQVGAFTLFTTQSKITSAQKEQLKQLYDYSLSLSEEMSNVRDNYFDGSVAFEKRVTYIDTGEEVPTLFSDAVNDFEQTLTDYPTLIYDGPFADSLLNKTSVFLKDKNEISKKEAAVIAADTLGINTSELRVDDDINSETEQYSFSKGDISISVTKKGGFVSDMSNPRVPSEETISPEEAVNRGRDFLTKTGYDSMEDTYYSVYDGICTINYAYKSNGIIYYSDLIKIGIALDTGEIASIDAMAYLMNHKERTLSGKTLSKQDAIKLLASGLSVISVREAVIPLETGKEAFCYEIHCKDSSGQEVLVYIDCATGEERDILLLLYSDDGILTK